MSDSKKTVAENSQPQAEDKTRKPPTKDADGITKDHIADTPNPETDPDVECTKAEARDRQCASDEGDSGFGKIT